MMNIIRNVLVVIFFAGAVCAETIQHRFLALDESRAQLHLVDQFDSSNDWTIRLPKGCRDIQLLSGNRVMVSLATGFAEFDLATQKKVREVRNPEFKKTETVVRLPNGNTVIGANKQGITFFEVNKKGAIVRQVNFPQFNTMRLMRLSPEGHFLFGANTDHLVEADWKGKVHVDFKVPGAKHIYWVKKLAGRKKYRVSTGYGKSIVDITSDGKVLRTLGGKEDYHFFSGPSELPNGNTVCSHWTGHKANDSEKGPQLIEFDSKGNVVWEWHDPKRAGTIHGVIISSSGMGRR